MAINTVILSGTVEPMGRDGKLEPVFNDQGQPSIHFTLVHKRTYKGRDGSQRESKVFVRCRAFGDICGIIEQSNGAEVVVVGRYDSEKVGEYYRPVVTVQQIVSLGDTGSTDTAGTSDSAGDVDLGDIF